MNYAVMPIADYVGACDTIREKIGATDLIKSGELAEQVEKVYESGKNSMVDPTKIIEKTASGIGSVTVDDVSEIPHEIKVQLSSDTITDFSGVNVTRLGKNLFDISSTLGFQSQYGGLSNTVTDSKLIVVCSVANRVGYLDLGVLQAGTYTLYIGGTNDRTKTIMIGDDLSSIVSTSYKGSAEKLTFALTETNRVWVNGSIFRSTESPYTFSNIQLAFGTATEYEPYIEPITYTAKADGTVEGVTSLSPNMTLQSNIESVGISMTYHKSWGMQTEYDRFWDSVQQNGTRYVYDFTFAGHSWNDETFKPKYDIVPVGGVCICTFRYCDITDLEKALEKAGVNIDTSKATNFENFLGNSQITVFPTLDLTSATTAYAVCNNATKLHTIRKIKPPKKSISWSSAFGNCSALKNIEVEGEFCGSNISFGVSPLTKASIISVVNALSGSATGSTLTLKLSAVNTAFETSSGTADGSTSEEWLNLVATKPNWTISLA